MSPTTPTVPATEEPAEAWQEAFKRQWMQTRLAWECQQVEKDQRRQAIVERLMRKTQDGTLGRPEPQPEEIEPMGVHIGDANVSHYHPAPTPTVEAPKPVAELAAAAGSTWLKRGLLAAALLGSGGLGAAGTWLGTRARPAGPEWLDTNTQYELRLSEPPPNP